MQAIIVAGGKGERLRPLTKFVAKPMVTVADKPILLHIINLLKQYKITDIIIALCYLPHTITSYFGDGSSFGVKINYILEDEQHPMGTAGAILKSKNIIKHKFIVVYGDILRSLNIDDIIKIHNRNAAIATIHAYKRFGANPKSALHINRLGRVISFEERPNKAVQDNEYVWSNGSFYIFEPRVFDFISSNKPSDFGRQIIPQLIEKTGRVYAYKTNDFFIDIGEEKKLKEARNYFTNSG